MSELLIGTERCDWNGAGGYPLPELAVFFGIGFFFFSSKVARESEIT